MANQFLGLGALLGAGGGGQAQNQMADVYADWANAQNANQQLLHYSQANNPLVWGNYEPQFTIKGGEGNLFVARFECLTTKDCFESTSLEREAVERGMRHYTGKWNTAIRHLLEAGMKNDELHVALAVIKPRLIEEAQRERSLEEGLRQAQSKAKALLVMCLTPEQVKDFNKSEGFTITVDHKVRGFPTGAFRINKGSAFNVSHVESGESFCVVAQEKVPVYDQMLTQKLLLENEPERFFKTANRSGGRGDFGDMYARELMRMYAEIQRREQNRAATVALPPERDGMMDVLRERYRRVIG